MEEGAAAKGAAAKINEAIATRNLVRIVQECRLLAQARME